jgi:hypothetical protein
MSLRARIPLLAVAATPLAAAAGEDPAVAAAREREKLVRTARFEVHVRDWYARGAVAPGQPEADAAFDADDVLVLDGNKVRVEIAVPVWGPLGSRPVTQVSVWDGANGRSFFPDGRRPGRPPFGVVYQNMTPPGVQSELLSPLMMSVRGLIPGLSPHPASRLTPTDRSETIDGHPCREYTSGPAPERPTRLWLDPQADYAVRRTRWLRPDRRTEQFDIRYQTDPGREWLPAGWTWSETGADGKPLRTISGAVTAAKLNEPVPADRFEVVFPPGARVHDQQTGKGYHVGPDGGWQEVGPGGEELADESADEAPPLEAGSQRRRGLIAGAIAVLGLAVLLVVWLRLRRSPARRPG